MNCRLARQCALVSHTVPLRYATKKNQTHMTKQFKLIAALGRAKDVKLRVSDGIN